MSLTHRYSLRKEYFGGLLLDHKTTSYEILKPEDYLLLRAIANTDGDWYGNETLGQTKVLQQRKSLNFGRNEKLTSNEIRIISPPEQIPEHCLSAPIKVYDAYTRKCNLLCNHCYSSSTSKFLETRRTLKQTEQIIKKFHEVGVMEWQFTGGEPTVAPDLFDAAEIAKSYGMKVSLNSNGCWSPRVTKKIFESCINEIIISIEGEESAHDQRRGAGSFRRTMETINHITAHNQAYPDKRKKVIINMAVGRDNLVYLDYVVRVAAAHRFNVNFVPLKPSGRAMVALQGEVLTTDEYLRFAKKVQCLRQDLQIHKSGIKVGLKHKDLFCPDYTDKSGLPFPFNYSECQALTTAMSLLPDGRVFSCPFLMDDQKYIGPHILDISVYEAWVHPTLVHFRNAIKTECVNCKYYMQRCRGKCKAAVLLNGGSIENNILVGEDPYCFKDLLAS